MGDVLVDCCAPYHVDIGVSSVPAMHCRASPHIMLGYQCVRLWADVSIWVAEQANIDPHFPFDNRFGPNDLIVQNLISQVR